MVCIYWIKRRVVKDVVKLENLEKQRNLENREELKEEFTNLFSHLFIHLELKINVKQQHDNWQPL